MKRRTGRLAFQYGLFCRPTHALHPTTSGSGHWLFQALRLWIMHKCSEPYNGVMMPRVQNHDAAHATPRRQTPHGWVKGMPAPLAVVCLSRSPRPYTAASKQLIGWRQPPAGGAQGSHVDGRPGQHHHGYNNVNRPTGPQIHKQKSSAALPHCFSRVVAQWRRKAHHLA